MANIILEELKNNINYRRAFDRYISNEEDFTLVRRPEEVLEEPNEFIEDD